MLAGFLLVTGRVSAVLLKSLACSVLLRSRMYRADECELWLGGLEQCFQFMSVSVSHLHNRDNNTSGLVGLLRPESQLV